jgi:hypothetical protein
MAVQQTKQLGLESGTRTVRIEVCEKGIVAIFEHDRRVESRAESFRQRSFARANRPFNGEVTEAHAGADDIIAR